MIRLGVFQCCMAVSLNPKTMPITHFLHFFLPRVKEKKGVSWSSLYFQLWTVKIHKLWPSQPIAFYHIRENSSPKGAILWMWRGRFGGGGGEECEKGRSHTGPGTLIFPNPSQRSHFPITVSKSLNVWGVPRVAPGRVSLQLPTLKHLPTSLRHSQTNDNSPSSLHSKEKFTKHFHMYCSRTPINPQISLPGMEKLKHRGEVRCPRFHS